MEVPTENNQSNMYQTLLKQNFLSLGMSHKCPCNKYSIQQPKEQPKEQFDNRGEVCILKNIKKQT